MSLLSAFFRFITRAIRSEGDPRSKRRRFVLFIGVFTLLTWQGHFQDPGIHFNTQYRVTASHGRLQEDQFFFFLYHLGLYPVRSSLSHQADTRDEAERLLRKDPNALTQEEGLTFRAGDHGRTYLFYVDALLNGRGMGVHLFLGNIWAFTLGLVALFCSFWWVRRPILGFVMIALLGSNPFQLYSVYVDENYFSWPITGLLFVLALNLPLMESQLKFHRNMYLAPLATGLAVAGIRTIRQEPTTLLLSVCIVYALAFGLTRLTRAWFIVILVGAFAVGNGAYSFAIHKKIEHTKQVLRDVGAKPYEGLTEYHHEFWHPVWCGLGDFDTKHGHIWDDRAAYRAALPELERRAGHPLTLNANLYKQNDFWGDDPRYPKFFFDEPGYHEVIRQVVLDDIRGDPWWYAGILWDRFKKILTDTTPISLQWGDTQLETKSELIGVLSLPLLAFLIAARRWFQVKLILFSAPLSATAFIVYSGGGTVNYSTFHIFTAAILMTLTIEGANTWLRKPFR